MNSLVLHAVEPGELRRIIDRAADALAGASSAAEILDARDQASVAYDLAKSAARLARAKKAHDEVVASAYRAQADALEIQVLAKRKLADEYDAAQDRGEIAGHGGNRGNQHGGKVSDENVATTADIGLTRPQIFEARQLRDAIVEDPGKLRRVLDEIIETGDEPTKARLRKELAPAVADMRRAVQTEKKERRVAREITLAAKIEALPKKRYGVILADPEWRFEPYNRDTGMDRSPDNHYPTSSTDEIAARDVASIAADDCVLFLWATAPMLPDAIAVMTAWGFAYKTHAVWVKQRPGEMRGTGYWFTGEHELLLVGVKGDVPAPAMGTQWKSVFAAPVGEHSAKPEESLQLIEQYFPNLPKIELNRRGPARDGWDAWGAEAEAEKPALPDRDPIAELLIGAGLAPSEYILELNRGLTSPHIHDLPSRLFRFPVEFMSRARTKGESRLLLRHPHLREHAPTAAYLDEIEEKTGIRPEWQEVDEFGRPFGVQASWWHAVDLCTDKYWKDLLATRQFTERETIFAAINIGLGGKSLSLKNARALMAALESQEPDTTASVALMLGKGVMPYRHDKSKMISPNIHLRDEVGAWMTIHGLEDGFFTYIGTYLSVTPAGMDRRDTVKEVDVPLPLEDVPAESVAPDLDALPLPPEPGTYDPTYIVVCGMRDGDHAQLVIRKEPKNRFLVSTAYNIDEFVSGSGTLPDAIKGYASAVSAGLASLRKALDTVAHLPEGLLDGPQRSSAAAGILWIDERLADWGMDAATEGGEQ